MVVGTPRLRITSIAGAGTSTVTVNYANTVAGKGYMLQYNANLGTTNWYPAGTKTAVDTTDFQTQSSVTPGPRYYRVYYTP